ncbi:MAG: tetratricopeptide repeat protein, partial [Caldilineaceae bacterium]|nr:tetratricopeptide repeat protein [Caldilineaceae bacterium]
MITRSVTLFIMTMSLLLHAVTPLLAQEDEAAEFDLFTDDNGILTIELPASWDDRRFGNWILEDETVGILLETAPDLADFHNGWDMPGMVLGLSTILAEREIGTALIDRYDLSAQCALVETDTSQDEIELTKVAQVHTIHTAIWGECGATTTSVVLLTLIPADNSYLIFVFGQFVEDLDYELAQRTTQSIVLNHLDRLPGSTVATPEPTPTPTKRAIRGLTLGRTSTISTTAEATPITNTVPIETTPTPAGEIDTTEPVTRTIRTNPITLHPIGKGDVLTTTTNTTDTTAITDTATVTTTTAPTTTIIADAPAPNRKPRLGSSHLTLGNDTQTATTDRQTGTTKTTPDPQDAEPDTTADALIEEARALATAGDIDGALARFEDASQLDPKLDLDPVAATVDALLSVGIGYYDDGDYATALRWFTDAVDLDPTDVSAHLWRGDANRLLTDYAAAIADYTAGIDLDEPGYDYAGAFNNRGRAYYYSDEFDAAIADFSMAIALAPDYTAAYDLRGSVYHDQQEYAKAVADFTMAITLADADYNYRWAYAYRGRSYAELEQYERAVADFSEAVAIDPTYTWAHEWLGYAYNQVGEYEAAIT